MDVIIITLAILAGLFCLLIGVFRQIFFWGGVTAGLLLSPLFAFLLTDRIPDTPYQHSILAIASIVVSALVFGVLGLLVGFFLRWTIPSQAKLLDRLLGGLVGLLFIFVLVWYSVPLMKTAGDPTSQWAEDSKIASWINDNLSHPPTASLEDLITESRNLIQN